MPYCKLEIYVPETHAAAVRTAVAAAGAGRLGNYDNCIWQSSGTGRFRPLPGSVPFLGQTGEIEEVNEAKLEMICEERLLPAVLAAMRATHPYETPAFQYWPVSIDREEK